jgi:4'-phosphopantetheinyl transferase
MMISLDPTWRTPPAELTLTPGSIHIWRAALEQPASVLAQLARTLSPDESARAARFHFERDQRHFTVGRGILRNLLAGYLSLPPAALAFTYGPQNKPTLATSLSVDLRFNLSHSHGQALFAFTIGREIGVDLEAIRRLDDAAAIARRFFSAQEYTTLMSLPTGQQPEGFFNCWTRKEAYIKALGQGLSHPLNAFDVSLKPGEPAALLAVRGDPHEVARWSMLALTPVAGYVAALVVEGHGGLVQCWSWG